MQKAFVFLNSFYEHINLSSSSCSHTYSCSHNCLIRSHFGLKQSDFSWFSPVSINKTKRPIIWNPRSLKTLRSIIAFETKKNKKYFSQISPSSEKFLSSWRAQGVRSGSHELSWEIFWLQPYCASDRFMEIVLSKFHGTEMHRPLQYEAKSLEHYPPVLTYFVRGSTWKWLRYTL